MARGNQGIVEGAGVELGPAIVVGLDDADALGKSREESGERERGLHDEGHK